MKIESIRSTKTDTIRGKKPSQGSSSAFTPILSSEEKPQNISSLSATQSVATIWAVQEVDSALEKRKKAVRKGTTILETLTALQKSLGMGGEISPHLKEVQYLLLEKLDAQGDPNLQDVLDAIYLRASVEAAKFGL